MPGEIWKVTTLSETDSPRVLELHEEIFTASLPNRIRIEENTTFGFIYETILQS